MSLLPKLNEARSVYQRHKDTGVLGSAVLVLGEIYNVVVNHQLRDKDKYAWLKFVEEEYKSLQGTSDIQEYVKDRVDLIIRISSVGNVFIEEEIVLLLTASITVEMICSLLDKFDERCNQSVTEVNKSIEEVAKNNEKSFFNSIKMIRKNRLLPTKNYWISDYD